MSPAPLPQSEEADLAGRVARLEAVEAIKALKHRYLRACDAKDPKAFRDCFVAAGAAVDYGVLGSFDADGMAAVFEKIALQKVDGKNVILDMHHGTHPDITVHDETHASGQWTLKFRQVNLIENTETVITGEYDDEYVVENGRWKIAACRFQQYWSITRPVDDTCRVVQ
ncbi:nuclear transport factor 2 family protein [Nocardia sp. NPDC051750]|uniref:nuclear transport factor 2 family protein n=1 Tax=Nocardia sp. NPDC051750 TaxID=3364325 RepID=UPI003799B9F4